MENDKKNRKNGGLTDETVEAVLLSGGDELLENKLLAELEQEKISVNTSKNCKKIIITDFSELPESLVFAENSMYKLFNRVTKCEFFVTGADVERKIGQDDILFNKVKNRSIKAFCVDDNIITFYQAIV